RTRSHWPWLDLERRIGPRTAPPARPVWGTVPSGPAPPPDRTTTRHAGELAALERARRTRSDPGQLERQGRPRAVLTVAEAPVTTTSRLKPSARARSRP